MSRFHTILHPTDFSECSERAFDLACSLARDCGAKLLLQHVTQPPDAVNYGAVVFPFEWPGERKALHDRLNALQSRASGIVVEQNLRMGDAAAQIIDLDQAGEMRPDRHGDARAERARSLHPGQRGRTGRPQGSLPRADRQTAASCSRGPIRRGDGSRRAPPDCGLTESDDRSAPKERNLKLVPQITFRDLPHSQDMAAKVRTKVAEFEEFCGQVGGCRVVVAVPHRQHERGSLYHVSIDVTVPGEEIAVNREPDAHTASKSFDAAVTDAFAAVDRLLEDYVRRRRGHVETHEAPSHARVRALLPHADHGFLEMRDRREIYFHRRSVVNARFDDLVAVREVTFVEKRSDKGPRRALSRSSDESATSDAANCSTWQRGRLR